MAINGKSALSVTVLSDLQIRMTRVFDAPRELVFDAYTKPEHLQHWWGRKGSTMPVCEADVRPGGKYRFVNRESDGTEHGFRGEYREIVRRERIVSTFEYEGMPGHISVDTVVFEEQDGKTTIIGTTEFDSIEDRDGMLQSGMEEGASETFDRLDEYLRTLSA
jgi:uncharacterized protein YndB with AHSA1/START domain